MAVSAKWLGNGPLHLMNKRVNLASDTIKVTLHTGSVPNQDTVDFRDDLANELSTAGGYTAGGVTLGSPTVTYDSGTNETRFDAADVSWTSATFSTTYAVVTAILGGASSADPVLGYVDFGGTETVSSGTFSIVWDSTGLLKITAS